MIATVKISNFLRELSLLEKIVAKKAAIPVLSNILIQAGEAGLLLSATDLEIGLIGACAAEVQLPGAVTLNASKLVDLVRAQSGDTLTLSLVKEQVHFEAGGFKSRLQALVAKDFPALPSINGNVQHLPRQVIKEMLPQVRFAVSMKEQRYYLRGAQLIITDSTLTMAATDGARLAVSTRPYAGTPLVTLIPTKALDELDSLLNEHGDGDIDFAIGERHLFFDVDGRLLISRQVAGEFPDYTRIIPTDNIHQARIPRVPCIAVVKRMVLIDNVVCFTFDADTLSIASESAEVGRGAEILPITYSGPPIKIYLRGAHVVDYCEATKSDTVDLSLKDAQTQVMFTDNNYLGVLMPMRG